MQLPNEELILELLLFGFLLESWDELYEVPIGVNEIVINSNKKSIKLTNLNRKREAIARMSAFQIKVVEVKDMVNIVVMLLRTVFQIDRLDILNDTIRTTVFEMYRKHLHVSWARVVDVCKALIKVYGRNEDY